jgi:hypothetical protein
MTGAVSDEPLGTSDHPAKAGVTGDVLKVLVDAGARRD